MNKNKILSGGGKNLTGGGKWGWRVREVGGEGEGSGGRGGGKWGERGREVGVGYPPVHPLYNIKHTHTRIRTAAQGALCWLSLPLFLTHRVVFNLANGTDLGLRCWSRYLFRQCVASVLMLFFLYFLDWRMKG